MDSGTLPRVLAGWRHEGSLSLEEHTAVLGSLPVAPAEDLVASVERSGLLGRGGAGFPTATKLRAVAGAGRGRRIVVVNGGEGEPASAKDRTLLAKVPHLVLDGAVLAAAAVGAREVIVGVKRTASKAISALQVAIGERSDGAVEKLSLVEVPAGYVAGEETALVNYLNTGRALPTFVPPRPYARGVDGRPTLIQNPETLANVALIARFGAEWFRGIGAENDPGSNLVSLRGAIARPGIYEIASGASLTSLVEAAGGTSEPVQAFLIGGYGGSWLPAERARELPLGRVRDTARRPSLGAGLVAALPASACGFCETGRIVGYLAEESAGQCGPCVHGLGAIAAAFDEISDGIADPGAHRWIERWSDDVVRRGACGHPDGAAAIAKSALYTFRDAVTAHESGGSCAARTGQPWALPLPDPAEVA